MRVARHIVITILLAAAFVSLQPISASDEDFSTFGTLIAALGNSNGIVVVTDSMGSVRDNSGRIHQSRIAYQKLLKYDDHKVCAIAGLGTAKVPAAPQLNADLLGVVAAYRDEIQRQGIRETIDSALVGLSTTLQFYLSNIADINARTGNRKDISNYHLQLLLVGYDLDGSPKIGELFLEVELQQEPGGEARWVAHEKQRDVLPVSKEFMCSIGGMNRLAQDALKNPKKLSGYQILEKYADEMAKDKGASLTLDDLEQLGRVLISLTAEKYSAVGKDRQVAALQSGKIARVSQPSFLPPTKPFSLVVFTHSSFTGGGQSIVSRGHLVKFYESTQFIGSTSNPNPFTGFSLTLDESIFVNCSFKNAILWYNGGSLYFDETNQITDSQLGLGAEAYKRPYTVRELQKRFPTAARP